MLRKPKLDRTTARALVDAGYMHPKDYFEMFSDSIKNTWGHSKVSTTADLCNDRVVAIDVWRPKKPN